MMDGEEMAATVAHLRALAASATTEAEVKLVTSRIVQITSEFRTRNQIGVPATLLEQAVQLDPKYQVRPHLQYLSDRVTRAVNDVLAGENRMLAVEMPPRMGKSTTLQQHGPIWFLRKNPSWNIISASHDPSLSTSWARSVRRVIEERPDLGIRLARDGGAAGEWFTEQDGGMFATSVRGSLTGRGGSVLLIDDPIKNFMEAHSVVERQALWEWWLSVASTRLEPPYLVIVIMTRWHQDDFVGRLFSSDYEGDPADWEEISLPALAHSPDDVLGRSIGEPLFSPLIEETSEQAVARWMDTRRKVGSYTFDGMYQQRPASPKGSIFDAGWWKFWTIDPSKATDDGRVVYLDPSRLTAGTWLDSWDASFDSTGEKAGSWVVGQRWVRDGVNRYLIAQQRGKWSFTQTLTAMTRWEGPSGWPSNPCGHLVHKRLVEKKANGAAILDTLKDKISGLKPITPKESKEARARAVTPEIEGGNVFLPHPGDPGNEWVSQDYLPEMRDFPNGFADDQVDSTTQALQELRTPMAGSITVPGRNAGPRSLDRTRAASTDRRRIPGR